MSEPKNFDLPKQIDRYLAAISKLYETNGLVEYQSVIVNAQVRVDEEWSYDGWDGGTYGHALFLTLPERLYSTIIKDKDYIQNKIREDINKVCNIQREFIDEVFLEIEVKDNQEWRKQSGLLITEKRQASPDSEKRIWNENEYRVFLSHKANVKREVATIKEKMSLYGVNCFVAHKDIHPTQEWQDEIENALLSMDAFVALMTEDFHESEWTDQEIGFAFGRGIPIIAVKLGRDPYGFIGKFQALSSNWKDLSKQLVKHLIKNERMLDAFIVATTNCTSYDHGNTLAEIFPFIEKKSNYQVEKLIKANNDNNQTRDSFGFKGTMPPQYGYGLLHYIQKWTGKDYERSPYGTINIKLKPKSR